MTVPRRVLALVDLVQDLDVLLPLMRAIEADPGFRLSVLVSRWLASRAPRIPGALRRAGLAFAYVDRGRLLDGRAPPLEGIDLVLTGSESTAGPHRWAHALVGRAKAAGIETATLQHGLDNLQRMTGPAPLDFASDRLFCWAPEASWPTDLPPGVRARLVESGRPAAPIPAQEPRFDLAVFESLHARGYADDQRALVLAQILGLALARPDLRIYVQTHPAGGWLDRARARLAAAGRITFAGSAAVRAAEAPARDAAAQAARVIVTPSTVALDAVEAGRPTALAFDGGPLYAPLPVLRGLEDWIAFADTPAIPPPGLAAFAARHTAPGDAIARILALLDSRGGKSRARAGISQ